MGRSVIGEVPAFAGMLLAKRGPFCFMSVFNQKSPLNDGRHRRHYGEAHGPWGRTKSLRKPQVRDRVAGLVPAIHGKTLADARNKSGHAISRVRLSEAFCPSQRAMCLPIVPPVPPVVQWRFFGVQDRHEAKRPTLGEKHSGESRDFSDNRPAHTKAL